MKIVPDYLKVYQEFDETTRSVAEIAVLIFQPFYEYSFERFYSGYVQRTPQYKIRFVFAELKKIDALEDYDFNMLRLSKSFLVDIFPEVIRKPESRKLLTLIESNFPASSGFYLHKPVASMQLGRRMLADYFLDKKEYLSISEKFMEEMQNEGFDLFCAMSRSKVYDSFISQLNPRVSFNVLRFLYQEAVFSFGDTTRLLEVADLFHNKDFSLLKNIFLSALKMHQGQFVDRLENIQINLLGYSTYMQSVAFAYKGQYKESLEIFEKGLKEIRKEVGPKYSAESHFSVFYFLVLMIYKPGSHKASVDKYIRLFQKSTLYDDQLILILAHLANQERYEALKQLGRFREDNLPEGNFVCQFIFILSHILIHKNLTEITESKARILLETAEANGYRLFALELRWILEGETGEDEKSGFTSLLSRIEQKENWEESLDSLLVIQSKEISGKRESESRLIYLVSFDEPDQYIRPVVQTYSARGWSTGKNVSLKRLKDHLADGMTEQDFRIASAIKQESSYYGKNNYYLDFQKALQELAGHPFLFLGDNPEVSVELIRSRPELFSEKTAKGFLLKTDIRETEKRLILKKETNTRYKLIELTNDQLSVIRAMNGQLFIPESGKEKLAKVLAHLSSVMTVHSDLTGTDGELKQMKADSRIRVQLLPVGDSLKAEWFVKPFGQVPPYCKPGKGGKTVYALMDNEKSMVIRDLQEETGNAGKLSSAIEGMIEADLNEPVIFEDPHDSLVLLETLKTHADIAVVEWPEGERFRVRKSIGFDQLRLSVKGRGHWFEMSGELKVDEDTVFTLKQLLAFNRTSKGRFVEMGNGEFLALSADLKKRLDDLSMYSVTDKEQVKINKFAVHALDGLSESAGSFTSDKAWKDFQSKLKKYSKKSHQVPANFQAELRPYQEEGFNWLARLADLDAGACLADDMGLGKTIQALALLLHRAQSGPALVICPASVVSNWVAETVRFAPSLNVHVFGNSNRDEVTGNLSASDLLITTYGLLQSEVDKLSGINWATVVLDEAHAIKNYQTKTSKSVMELKADFRLILTGTPVQNNIGELWNLFNFINPGLLGSLHQFNENFVTPVIKHGSTSEKVYLKKLISPFILRRTKSNVLDDLPPKTEITQLIELTGEEMAFYEALRRQAIENIESAEGTSGQQHIRALAEITRLRLACCHPSLVDKDLSMDSSKLNWFLDLVEELLENKHRALVFSQFIGHLSIVRQWLDRKNISYLYLDGSTPVGERASIVKDFQSGKGDLFLISLKAGGLGLNLTSADYVIHLDPWWNPAIEDQASDRSYRIGQSRPVTVYRLVAKDTIEERIIDLHHSKRDMADSLLEGSDQAARLTTDDLLKILGEMK